MKHSIVNLCIFAAVLVTCVLGNVPVQYGDENDELYETFQENEMNIAPPEKRTRGLDTMAGISFGTIKKRIDTLRGGSFGAQKRDSSADGGAILVDQSQAKLLRSLLQKNGVSWPLDGQAPSVWMKKTALPYYMQSIPIPMLLRSSNVKDKGI